VIEERSGTATTPTYQYVWGLTAAPTLVLRDDFTGSTTSPRLYAQQDANGNVTALVDATGVVKERYLYDPYGAVTVLNPSTWLPIASSAYAWRYLFQDGRLDAPGAGVTTSGTGWYTFGARDYVPSQGTWAEKDPITFAGGGNNFYQFVGGNPVGAIDPSGLIDTPPGGWNWPWLDAARGFFTRDSIDSAYGAGAGLYDHTLAPAIGFVRGRDSTHDFGPIFGNEAAFENGASVGNAAGYAMDIAAALYGGSGKAVTSVPNALKAGFRPVLSGGGLAVGRAAAASVAPLTGTLNAGIGAAGILNGAYNLNCEGAPRQPGGADQNPAQMKRLSPDEIKKLQQNGIDPHDLKPNSRYDLFKDKDGNLFVKPKNGSGPGDPTGLNINEL
jgi:RHS repeat-associated protein